MLSRFGRRQPTSKTLGSVGQWLHNLQSSATSGVEREVVVDLTAVPSLNSRELGEIAKIQLALRAEGRKLILQNARREVCELFEMTRMDRLVEVRQLSTTPQPTLAVAKLSVAGR